MKKLVLVLLVAMLSVPAFAAPVIKLAKGAGADLGKVLVYVDANGGSLASGIGLTITATGGNITGVTGFKADGESKAASKGYGIYPGQITFDGLGVPTYNSPVASGIGTPVVALEFGALYARSVPADAPDPCSLLCKLTVASGVTKVEVAGDSVSCGTVAGGVAAGIIDEGLNAFAVNASVTMACKGDVDGDGYVRFADLGTIAGWLNNYGVQIDRKKTIPSTDTVHYKAAADADGDGYIRFSDLGTFAGWLNNYGVQIDRKKSITCPHIYGN